MESLEKIRKYLHQNPEISGEEINTSQFIYDELHSNCSATQLVKLDCHAVIAHFKGEEEGSCTMIRADMDALPIQEINDSSINQNTLENRISVVTTDIQQS